MLKIFRGNLDISVSEIDQKIHNKLRRKPLKLELREFKKFVYFLEKYKEILNPISAMIVNGELLHIHPGNFRLQSAYFRMDQYIDCIFVLTDDERSLEKLKSLSNDARPSDDIVMYKNGFGGWWEINTVLHQEMSNDTVSRRVFDRALDDEFEKFKQKTKKFQWKELYQNSEAEIDFQYQDREGIFQSVCYALGKSYPGETKFEIKQL